MKLKTFLSTAIAAAALATLSVAAQADTYQFTLTGDYSASWQLDSNPVPDAYNANAFAMFDVEGNFPDSDHDVVDLIFWNASQDGGFTLEDYYGGVLFVVTSGDQLYTGTESNPTFKTGTFSLTEYLGSGAYQLTISNVSAVPEPASIALMLGGLGLVGVAARRRKTEEEAA